MCVYLFAPSRGQLLCFSLWINNSATLGKIKTFKLKFRSLNDHFVSCLQNASYGKKNGAWYAAPTGMGWTGKTPHSRKASIADAELPPPGGGSKPSSGRVIRIINNTDHTVQVSDIIYIRKSTRGCHLLDPRGNGWFFIIFMSEGLWELNSNWELNFNWPPNWL